MQWKWSVLVSVMNFAPTHSPSVSLQAVHHRIHFGGGFCDEFCTHSLSERVIAGCASPNPLGSSSSQDLLPQRTARDSSRMDNCGIRTVSIAVASFFSLPFCLMRITHKQVLTTGWVRSACLVVALFCVLTQKLELL